MLLIDLVADDRSAVGRDVVVLEVVTTEAAWIRGICRLVYSPSSSVKPDTRVLDKCVSETQNNKMAR